MLYKFESPLGSKYISINFLNHLIVRFKPSSKLIFPFHFNIDLASLLSDCILQISVGRVSIAPIQSLELELVNLWIVFTKFLIEISSPEPIFIGLSGILEDAFNMQRFDPGKGFFTWHCETGADSNSYRQIVWMVYLNDIKEKGGTLFKYQNLRIAPEAGKMLIWPAGWTHFHKSEIAPKETKYILTGWYVYSDIVGKEPPPPSHIQLG